MRLLIQINLISVNTEVLFIHCRRCNTSTPGMCLNNPKSENSTSKTKTKKSETEKSMKKVTISVVCVLVTIMLWIIGMVLYKTLGKKGNF